MLTEGVLPEIAGFTEGHVVAEAKKVGAFEVQGRQSS
jgi:hypothetical protein